MNIVIDMRNLIARISSTYKGLLTFASSMFLYFVFTMFSSENSFARSSPPVLKDIIGRTDIVVIGDLVSATLTDAGEPIKTVNLTVKADHMLLKNQSCDHDKMRNNIVMFRTGRSESHLRVGLRAVAFLKKMPYDLELADPDSIFLLTRKGEVNDKGKLLSFDHIFDVVDYRNTHLSENQSEVLTEKIQTLNTSMRVPIDSVETVNLMKLEKLIDYLVDGESYNHCEF